MTAERLAEIDRLITDDREWRRCPEIHAAAYELVAALREEARAPLRYFLYCRGMSPHGRYEYREWETLQSHPGLVFEGMDVSELARRAGGWWTWDTGPGEGPRFVPLPEWEALYAEWKAKLDALDESR